MGIRKAGGFIFRSYIGDHSPLHVHIFKGSEFIGRWDIEHQRPMDDFALTRDLRNALRQTGYLLGDKDGNGQDK